MAAQYSDFSAKIEQQHRHWSADLAEWWQKKQKKYQHMSVLYVRKNTHTKQNQKKNENTIYTKRNVMSEMTNILMVGPKIYDECQKR